MSLSKIGKLKTAFNNRSSQGVASALGAFANVSTAGKWLGQINVQKNGQSIMTQKRMIDILKSQYAGASEEEIVAALNKGAASANIGNIALSGTGGMLTSLKNAGSGLLTFLKPYAPLIIGTALAGLGYTGFKILDNKFDLTKGTTTKKYETAKEKNSEAQSDLETAKSEYSSNQDRIYELRAKENRSLEESQELNTLQDQNELLGAQVSLKERLANSAKIAEADAAQKDLNKKYNQQDYFADGNGNYNPQAKVHVNDLDEAQAMMDYIQYQQDRYDTAYNNIKKRHNGNMNEITEEENATLERQQENIDKYKADLSEKISGISESAQSLVGEDGKALDPKFQSTLDTVDALISNYSKLVGSASGTENKLNNIFALDKYSDLQTKLEGIGKSKGTAGILDVLNNDSSYTGLKTALEDKNVSLDDLAAYIMSIADPEKKNIEGIKKNLQDEFSYLGKLPSTFKPGQVDKASSVIDKFLSDKSDTDIEGFWNYIQNQGLIPKDEHWSTADLSSNWDKYIESTKSAEPESATFASKFKNSAEDTATDLDTVTDNFQTDISNIKSAMDSLNSGEMKNSDLTDLIQQFPELAGETDNLQQGLQNLALDKASTAIGKIRDFVKDTTDPKELAQADRYIQSIMDNLNTSEFDMSNAKDNVIKQVRSSLKGSEFLKDNAENTLNNLFDKYGNDEYALQAIVKLSADPSMATASLDEWILRVDELRPQIHLDTNEKDLENLSKDLTRLQTDASDMQTIMNNKSAFNQKVTAQDYNDLIENGNAQITNLNKQIKDYQDNINTINKNKGISPLSDEDNEKIKEYQDQIQSAQMSIKNMEASQAGWKEEIQNLPITNVTNLSSALSTAMSEMQSNTGLTGDSVKNLTTQFSDLTAQGTDISGLFTRTAKGLKLNTSRFKELSDIQNQMVMDDFGSKIADQEKNLYDKNGKLIESKRQELETLKNLQNEYLAQYKAMEAQTSQWQRGVNAESTPNAGDHYKATKSKLESLKEMYDKGEVGTDDFKEGAAYFSPYGFSDEDNFIENYNKWKPYYTDDKSGPLKFLNLLKSKGLATYKTLEDGSKQWRMTFTDSADAAKTLGMGEEQFRDYLGRYDDMGAVVTDINSVADGQANITEKTNELIEAQKKYSELVATNAPKYAIDEQAQVVEDLKNQVSDANTALDEYIDGTADRETKRLNTAKQQINDLAKEYQSVKNDPKQKEYAQGLIDNIQDIAKDNKIKLTPEFEVDEGAFSQLLQQYQSQEEAKRQANKGSVDLTNRPQIQAQKLIDMGYEDVGDPNNQATVFSQSFSNEDGTKEVLVTPILPDGDVLEPDSLEKYANEILSTGKDTMGIGIRTFEGDNATEQANAYANALHGVQEAYFGTDKAAKESLNSLKDYSAQELLGINYGDGQYDEQFADAEKSVDGLVKQFQDAGMAEKDAQLAAQGLIQVMDDMGLLKASPKVDTSSLEKAQEETEETSADLQNLSGSTYTIEANLSTSGGTDDLKNSLASIPQGTTATVDVSVTGEDQVEDLTSAMESVPDNTPVTITCDVQNQEQLDAINAKADELNGQNKQITVNATIKKDSAEVDSYKPEDKNAKAKYTVEDSDVRAYKPPDKTGVVNYIVNASNIALWTPPDKSGTVVYHAKVEGAPKGAGASGTMTSIAHADGTAYNMLNLKPLSSAHAGGNVALGKNETALTNEVGTESIVRNGVWSLLPGGPHFENLKKGDIIFNASQTKDLLKYGKTSNNARAYAAGSLGCNAYSLTGFNFRDTSPTRPSGNGGNNGGNNNNNNNNNGGGGGNASKSWEDVWKNIIDWFERLVTKFENRIDLAQAKSENASSLSTQNNYLSNAIKDSEVLLNNYVSARKMYVEKSNAYAQKIGLSSSLKEKVQNGTVKMEELSETDKKKVEAYQKWYDKILECDKAIQDLKAREKELYSQKLDNITNTYDTFRSVYENSNNVLSSQNEGLAASGKSQAVGSEYYRNIEYQRANQQSQSNLISKEIKEYQSQLYQIKKKYGVNSPFYKEALAGLRELQTALEDSNTAVAELTNQLDELALNAAQFSTDKYTTASDKQAAYRDYKESHRYYDPEKGDFAEGVTEEDYANAITTNENTIKALQDQKTLIQQKMLTLDKDSPEYQQYAAQLAEIDKKILETENNTAELKSSMIDLRFKPFDEAQEQLDKIIDDCGNLRDMMDSESFFNDDGSFTDTGLANIALTNKEMDAYRQEISDCTAELDRLEELKESGAITAEQYKERSEKAMSEIQQASKGLYSSQQSLLDMYENKITKENELLQENIDKRKKALDNKKDYYEYDKTIKSKSKDINALKAQIAALEGTSNAAAKARLTKLKAELQEKEDDLADTKYDHQVDMESKGYDELSERADDALDDTLQSLKTNTELQKSVINNMLSEVKDSYKETFAEINKIIQETGYITSEAFRNLVNENTISNSTNETVTEANQHPGDYTNIDTSNTPNNSTTETIIDGAIKDSENAENASNGIGYDKDGNSYDTTKGEGNNKEYINAFSLSLSARKLVLTVDKEKTIKVSYKNAKADILKDFSLTSTDVSVASMKKNNKNSFTVKAKKTGRTVITVHPVVSSAAPVKVNVTVRQKTYNKHANKVNAAIKNSGYNFSEQERQSIRDSVIIGRSEGELNDKKKFADRVEAAIQKKLKEKLTKWYGELKNKSFKKADYEKKHELVQHFNKKGKDVSATQLKEVADILGMKYPKSYSKWTGSQKTELLKKLQGYGFSKGGIVRRLLPADTGSMIGNAIIRNGDTGFIGARAGESVLTEEFTKLLKPSIAAMNGFTDMMGLDNKATPNSIPSVQNQDITFNAEINLSVGSINNDTDIQELGKRLTNVMYEDLSKRMTKDLRKDMQKLTGRNR